MLNEIIARLGSLARKAETWEQRVQDAEQNISEFVNDGKAQFPTHRLSLNQLLQDSNGNGVPDGYTIGANVVCQKVDEIATNRAWNARSDIEREFLTALGAENTQYYRFGLAPAEIWSIQWDGVDLNNVGTSYLFWQSISGAQTVTTAGAVKLLSGSVSADSWFGAAKAGECAIVGAHQHMPAAGYMHAAPKATSTTGEILVCLPASVAGHAPLDRWGHYAGIND